ncbi:hypothetical protein AAVH_00696 [Aphelenchoides avenae]|nr:hypothetical protein AAVH_00696 [Aphelenchus avenae]
MEAGTALHEQLNLICADYAKAKKDLENRERLASSILAQLGSLPPLACAGVTSVLGVRVKTDFVRSDPSGSEAELLWTKSVDDWLCACVRIQMNEPGSTKLSFLADDTEQTVVSSVWQPLRSHEQNPLCKTLLVATNKRILQRNDKCLLCVDLATATEGSASICWTYELHKPDSHVSLRRLRNSALLDAEATVHVLMLVHDCVRLGHSATELSSFFAEHPGDFDRLDLGTWQLIYAQESSVWSGLIVYVCHTDHADLPPYSIAFHRDYRELSNFIGFLEKHLATDLNASDVSYLHL